MNQYSICIFGDSISWGAWDKAKDGGGWPRRLKNYFERNDSKFKYFFYTLGIPGDNTEKLLNRFKIEAKSRNPNVIIFAIGINDSQFINDISNSRISIKQFERNIKNLIVQAKEYTKSIVFIGLTNVDEDKTAPVLWSNENKFYTNERISKYNSIIKNSGEMYVEMKNIISKDELTDGLHPNSEGHFKMYKAIKSFLINNNVLELPS